MLISQMNVQELLEAVAGYQPIAPATRKGWQYAIRGIEETPVDAIGKRFVVLRRTKLNTMGYKQSYVRTQLGYCGSIWQIAMEQMALVDENPWRGSLKGLDKGEKDYPYLPLSHYVEAGLGNHPIFMGLWYHGFRVNELACISPEELILDHPVPHFKLKSTAIRGIKNRKSMREVPIHPLYLAGGFLNDFRFTTNPKAGDNFSRWMKTRSGHSAPGIRHNIVTRMRQAGIEYSIAAAILGHDATGMTSKYGKILLEDKLDQLQKLR